MPKILIFVVSCLLLAGAALEVWPKQQSISYVIDPTDISLAEELSQLSVSPLTSLFYNLARLHELSDIEVASVSYTLEEGKLIESALDSQWGIDRIGKYYKVNILVTGDAIEQMYLLKLLNRDFARALLIQSIEADSSQMAISGRLYGAL